MRTGAEYKESLRKMKPVVYYRGEKIDNLVEHPLIRWSVNTIAQIYDWNRDPRFADILTTTSPLTGDRINRFMHVFGSINDLMARQRQIRFLEEKLGSCTLMCTMLGGINSLYSTTYDIDQKCGTSYHQRFREWLSHIHKEDLFTPMAMMDAKGNRSLSAGKQVDPDLYLRIVEERENGVVVRGAKAHQTAPMIAEECLVTPCDVMRDKTERNYAIAFAIPADTKGITYIYQHNLADAFTVTADKMDLGNVKYGCQFGTTALMVFDNVFVPKERIFMQGEWEFTNQLVRRTGTMARLWQVGCRPAIFSLLTGATRLIAEYNGVANSPHIRNKLTDMSYLTETVWGLSLAAAACGEPMPSGAYLPNSLLTNIAKLQSTNSWYELEKLAIDICGGLVVSVPSEKDFRNPETKEYLEKYLKGVAEVPTEHRMRIVRFIQSFVGGPVSGALHHSGGPMENQKIVIHRETDFEQKKKAVKILAGIEDGELVDLGQTPFPKTAIK